MQNLDQKRALNAMAAVRKYDPQGKNDGNVIKKVPTMIQQNGLLGAIAFALDDKSGHAAVLKGAMEHYQTYDPTSPAGNDLNVFAEWLCKQDSARLRAATAEILAYLNFYRRFASQERKNHEHGND
ncbi:MAG: type III-B CRISPR module-associated protein Cmr5 [Oligosphaeraceae bacterium]